MPVCHSLSPGGNLTPDYWPCKFEPMQKRLHIKNSVVYLFLMGLLGGPSLQDKHYLCTSSERVVPVEGWGIWGCSVKGVSEEIKSVSQTVILKPGE